MVRNRLNNDIDDELRNPQGGERDERRLTARKASPSDIDHRARFPDNPEHRRYIAKRSQALAPTAPKLYRLGHFDPSNSG